MFATGTGASLDVIRASGAVPIDYRTTSIEEYVATCTNGAGFDVVLDTVGGTTLDGSFTAVKRYTGHVVSILGWGTHNLAPLSFRGATNSGVFALLPLLTGEGCAHHGEILAQVTSLAEAGQLRPRVHPTVFDLEAVAEAHRLVKDGGVQGKVVVRVAPAAMSWETPRRTRSPTSSSASPGTHGAGHEVYTTRALIHPCSVTADSTLPAVTKGD